VLPESVSARKKKEKRVGLPIVFLVIFFLLFFQDSLALFFEPCEPLVQVFDRSFKLLDARFEVSRDR
jgi:hypothetical protein